MEFPLQTMAERATYSHEHNTDSVSDSVTTDNGLYRSGHAAQVLWSPPVAQGYAGAAIVSGRVYHHDYDEANSEWCVNCRPLVDGKRIWQFPVE